MKLNMGSSTKCFSGGNGILRIITLILGLISIGLAAYYCFPVNNGENWENLDKELELINATGECILGMVITAFIISIILIVLLKIDVFQEHVAKKVDGLAHIILGMLLVLAAILFTIHVDKLNKTRICQGFYYSFPVICEYYGRIATALFGFIYGIVYFILGFRILA